MSESTPPIRLLRPPVSLRGRDVLRSDGFRRGAIALAVAFAIVAVIFAALDVNPADAYWAMIRGSLSGSFNLGQTLSVMTPLVLTGLAAAIPFSARQWNIGGEGQLWAGAIGAVAVALGLAGTPAAFLALLAVAAGIVAGGLWGAIAGVLKARFGANEVIVTLMLNFIAILLGAYVITGVWSAGGIAGSTREIADAARLPNIWPGTTLHLGIAIATGTALLVALLFARTRMGFTIRVAGFNPEATRRAGFNLNRTIVLSLALGGACAGLGGALAVIGTSGLLARAFSPGYGFTGIAIALLARLNPIAVLPAAFFFAMLVVGGAALPTSVGLSTSMTDVITSLLVLLLLAAWVIRPRYPQEA